MNRRNFLSLLFASPIAALFAKKGDDVRWMQNVAVVGCVKTRSGYTLIDERIEMWADEAINAYLSGEL